jgi:hypothetical protein
MGLSFVVPGYSNNDGVCYSVLRRTVSLTRRPSLPALREFEVVHLPAEEEYTICQSHLETFLHKHGSKLRSFRIGPLDLPIFQLCPNVIYVKMAVSTVEIVMFTCDYTSLLDA